MQLLLFAVHCLAQEGGNSRSSLSTLFNFQKELKLSGQQIREIRELGAELSHERTDRFFSVDRKELLAIESDESRKAARNEEMREWTIDADIRVNKTLVAILSEEQRIRLLELTVWTQLNKSVTETLSQEPVRTIAGIEKNEIEELKRSNQLQKEENDKIFKELNEKRINNEFDSVKTKEINELKQEIIQKENEIKSLKENQAVISDSKNENFTDNEILKEYENKMKEFNYLNSLYIQLKDQFEKKQLVLHKTRQELFQIKEKLTASQREINDDCKDLNECEKSILFDLDKTLEELNKCKNENRSLEQIISILFGNKDCVIDKNETPEE